MASRRTRATLVGTQARRTAAVGGSIRIEARSCLVIVSSREARLTTGPKTVTFTWSMLPILPATARPLAMPMPTRNPRHRRCGKRRANAQRRPAGPLDGVGLRQRPAPEAHRRVAVKIADHAPLLQDVVRHHAQGLADAVRAAEQVAGRPLALLA